MYNNYSFDLWLTLIKSNPLFKQKRNEYIFNTYCNSGFSLEAVSQIVRIEDVSANKMSEVTGVHVNSKIILYRILDKINTSVTTKMIDDCDEYIQNLFIEYPPSLYDENTKSVLEELVKKGKTLNILSNTGFIKGNTIRIILDELGIYGLFSYFLFSDELGLSKPNSKIFEKIEIIYIIKSSICHVGDNPIADGGSVSVGIDFIQINSNDKTIKDLL